RASDSTETRSPPTSRVSAAMSSVDVMTLSGPLAARRDGRAAPAAAAWMKFRLLILIVTPLERVRSVGPDAELKLKEKLIGAADALIVTVPVLGPDLAELARPVRDQRRLLVIRRGRPEDAVGAVDADATEPAPGELVFTRSVEPEGLAQTERLLAM